MMVRRGKGKEGCRGAEMNVMMVRGKRGRGVGWQK